MAVAIETEPVFAPCTPVELFPDNYLIDNGVQWDVHPDGERFLMVKLSEDSSEADAHREVVLVQNWVEELKRLVPVK